MRKPSLAALFCVFLAAAPGAFAQAERQYDVVFSVEGWGKLSTRLDGKGVASDFSFLTRAPQGTAGGNVTVQNFELGLPIGDTAAIFLKNALRGEAVKTMLVESFVHGMDKAAPPAPFAVRLTDVRVTSVALSMSGTARVALQASRIEVFATPSPGPSGAPPGGSGQRFGYDMRMNKAF